MYCYVSFECQAERGGWIKMNKYYGLLIKTSLKFKSWGCGYFVVRTVASCVFLLFSQIHC